MFFTVLTYFVYFCSLIYIAENMDPLNNFPPLFETKLELNLPHINFVPSLDTKVDGNIVSLIETIMNDVMHMTTLISRIYSEYNHPDYMVRQVQSIFFN